MHMPKRYGDSKIEKCPFCERQSTTVNSQSVPVCQEHKNTKLADMRCLCGDELEIRQGKYGTFFLCTTCGPQNMRKVFETNALQAAPAPQEPAFPREDGMNRNEKERTQPMIRSDDPRYFD